MPSPKLLNTDDGSQTLHLEEMDETYHSTHGALTEANYVYIENGFSRINKEHINILEIGFGTGLNALATLDAFLKQDKVKSITYTTLEKFPIEDEIISQLKYGQLTSPIMESEFASLHQAQWESTIEIAPNFHIHKKKLDLLTDSLEGEYDLIYYDAFAPSKQVEMWSNDIIKKVTDVMTSDALLTTYCAQGDAKRAFRECGLKVKRLPGPPGKWHMLNAFKQM